MMDLNVLYCFDSGYNTQTVVTINSILHKIDDIKLNKKYKPKDKRSGKAPNINEDHLYFL